METDEDGGTKALRRAKALLKARGWGKGQEFSKRLPQPLCAMTAIFVAVDELYQSASSSRIRAHYQAYNRFMSVIGVKYVSQIPDWNDNEEIKEEHVMEAFDKAIELKVAT